MKRSPKKTEQGRSPKKRKEREEGKGKGQVDMCYFTVVRYNPLSYMYFYTMTTQQISDSQTTNGLFPALSLVSHLGHLGNFCQEQWQQ